MKNNMNFLDVSKDARTAQEGGKGYYHQHR